MTNKQKKYLYPKSQHGFILITALGFLVMLTMLGVTALDSTNLDEIMTRNARSQAAAKQASESALRDAEAFIDATITHSLGLEDPTTPGQYGNAMSEPDPLIPANWVPANTRVATSPIANPAATAATTPRYLFTFVGSDRSESSLNSNLEGYDRTALTPISFFKTTARGVAADGVTVSILQIYFAKRLNDQ